MEIRHMHTNGTKLMRNIMFDPVLEAVLHGTAIGHDSK